MLGELSFKQLLEWEAFDELHPIGEKRGDWQAASICRVMMDIAAAQCGSKKRFRNADFLLEFKDEPESELESQPKSQTWQEMKMYARMYVAQSAKGKKKRR